MTLSLPPVQPPTRPPIRPGWLTRLANRLGVRRSDLLRATIATIVGAPVVGTAVLLATVPVPQAMSVPFAPAPAPPTIATSSAAEPPQAPARTHGPTAPRVTVRPAPVGPSAARSGARTAPPRTTAPPSTAPSTPEPTTEPTTGERSTSPDPTPGVPNGADLP